MAPRKHQPDLAQAAEKASLVIRGLQSRLRQNPDPVEETTEQLEQQLQNYFERIPPQNGALESLRERVVDGVVDRILGEWRDGAALESLILNRLIDRVLDRLAAY